MKLLHSIIRRRLSKVALSAFSPIDVISNRIDYFKKVKILIYVFLFIGLSGSIKAQYTNLLNFNGTNGSLPYNSVIVSGNTIYGMTTSGGTNNEGTIYTTNTDGSGYRQLYDFTGTGVYPFGALTLSGGVLYGTTSGYTEDGGTVFSIDTNGTGFTQLHNFYTNQGGQRLAGALTLSGNVLYGTTFFSIQDPTNWGSIFSINTDGSGYTVLESFSNENGSNGSVPYGTLVLSGNVLYGLNAVGGASGDGVVFSITTNGLYTVMYNFDGLVDGANPYGSLILSGSKLYGMTYAGGVNNDGVIFSITTAGKFTVLYDFDGTHGANPSIGSALALSGNVLYGMTNAGGANNDGCIFSINTNGSGYQDLLDFNGTNGSTPYGALAISGNDGYGMTYQGGTSNDGVLFRELINGVTCNLTVSASVTSNVTCYGGDNGSVSATPSGGTSPYTYSWSVGGKKSTKSGLTAGTYTITVTDQNECSASSSVIVTQPAAGIRDSLVNLTEPICHGGSGAATVGVKGGKTPYTYIWSPNVSTTATASTLSIGTYTITINDNNGCASTALTFTITQPKSMRDSIVNQINESCYGGNNGSVTIGVKYGATPYTYSWFPNVSTTATATGLSAGTYIVTVFDNLSCTALETNITITQPLAISVSFTVDSNVNCYGSATGVVKAIASGGDPDPNYFYSWSNGSTTKKLSNLSAGVYTVTVTDANGCTDTGSVTLTQPIAPLSVTVSVVNSKYYRGTGSATASASGGTAPYSYSWAPSGGTNATATGLSVGVYTVTVIDAQGCTAMVQASINQPYPWTDTIGVSLSGDTLRKYASSGWGNGGGASQSVLYAGQNGSVKVGVSGLSGKVAFGFTSINVAPDYRTFDFAFLVYSNTINIYQRGVLIQKAGTVINGDTLKIKRVGSTVLFMKNNIVLYTSTPPTNNNIVASVYTGSLEAVASLYDKGSSIAGMNWNFSQNLFIGGNITPQIGPDSLGTTVLPAYIGQSPFQYIWNLARYPFRNQYRPFLDSVIIADTLSLDTTAIFHSFDSLRQNYQNNHLMSGVNAIAVIDSNFDTTAINSNIGEAITWMNTSGLTISKVKSPRIVQYIMPDSLFSLTGVQPNLSEPVTCYSDSGITLTKTDKSGWTSGQATSVNSISYTSYGKVSFVIPSITSVEAAGIKIDTVPNTPGYTDILYGFYFQRGTVFLLSNGSVTQVGTYRAGDMFSIENAYDTVKLLQRIIFRQENQLVKIVYINRSVDPIIRYVFQTAIHTTNIAITNIQIIGTGWFIGPLATATILPASCAFPNTDAINMSYRLPLGWSVASYNWSPGGATTASISNVPPGQYNVTVTYHEFPSGTYTSTYGPFNVGYKVYWANMANALPPFGPGNSNSLNETGAPPAGGNSSNSVQYTPTTGTSWIQFNIGSTSLLPPSTVAFGFSSNGISYNANDINCGLIFLRQEFIYHYTLNFGFFSFTYTNIVYNVSALGKSSPTFSPAFSYILPLGVTTNNFLISYDNPYHVIRVYLNNAQIGYSTFPTTTATYAVKATLNWNSSLGSAFLDNGLCNFGCPYINPSYSTLAKTLDGSYYVTPYGVLRFRYDEEYVNNNNPLSYTIFDMGHNVMGSSTLTPDDYKDNYYAIDLTALNSAIANGYFILQVTNKKGEVTELRFKN